MEKPFDLLVIGAGPGGYTAAQAAAKAGLRTAVVERQELGGTCINRGCIPTKALIYASSFFDAMGRCDSFGLSAKEVTFDFPKLFQYKEDCAKQFREEIARQFADLRVTYLEGSACLLGGGKVQVTRVNGKVSYYQAEKILLATGACAYQPPIPGVDLPEVLTSEELLANPRWQYDRLTIVGGGVVGVEFASIFHALGAQVTILEQKSRLLAPMDAELSEGLEQMLRRRGIQTRTNVSVQEFLQQEEGVCCRFLDGDGKEDSVCSDRILIAAGRKANLKGLFAPGLEPEQTGGKLRVNQVFQTSIPDVYAIGDMLEGIQLAHLAAAQGTYVVDYLCHRPHTTMLSAVPSCAFVDLPIVPSCIYINPEIATVGISEEEAKSYGMRVVCGRYSMQGNGKAILTGDDSGFIKLVFEAHSRELIGAQMLCPRATDMIGEMSTAIANGLTASQLMYAVRAHPTFNEAVAEAVRNSLEQPSNPS